MNFCNDLSLFTEESQNSWTNDWSSSQNQLCQKLLPPSSSNMLLQFSNNLITYENSYKKQKKGFKQNSEHTQNIKKRKIRRKKLDFYLYNQNIEPSHLVHLDSCANKQNKKCESNFQEQPKQVPQDNSKCNLIKLDRMFKILKEFNSLNESILPFKVNLNKISHKRILANMAFKQFTYQNNSSLNVHETVTQKEQDTSISRNLQLPQRPIQTQFMPIKRRVYSLDIREKEQISKRKIKRYVTCNAKSVFCSHYQNKRQTEKRDLPFTRRRRSFSVKRPQKNFCEKTIEQVRQNYNRSQKQPRLQKDQPKLKEDSKTKESQYFSDSRFFTKTKQKTTNKRQVLAQIHDLHLNN